MVHHLTYNRTRPPDEWDPLTDCASGPRSLLWTWSVSEDKLATLGVQHKWRPLSAREIAEWADSLGGVVQVLEQANPEDRAALSAEFGLTPRYDPTRQRIKATAELSRVARGVGGPTARICDWQRGVRGG